MAPPPLRSPADTLQRRGDLVSSGRQPISLAPRCPVGYLGRGLELWETTQTENPAGCNAARAGKIVFIETDRHLHVPHACLASGWRNELADEFSSELRPKVIRAATLVSGPTTAWGTAGCMDEETATIHRGQATDDENI